MNSDNPRPVSSRATYLLGGVAVAVIVVAAVLWWPTGGGAGSDRAAGYGSVRNTAVRVTLESDGAQLLGVPGRGKVLDIYEDPICPGCGALERIYGQELAQAVDQGRLTLRYHYVAFLDHSSPSGDYSTRAAAALRCFAQAGDAVAYARYHADLFTAKQPAEGGNHDHTDAELAALAKAAGADESATTCIADGAQHSAVKIATASAKASLAAALNGTVQTPAVFDGTHQIDVNNEDWVAIAAK